METNALHIDIENLARSATLEDFIKALDGETNTSRAKKALGSAPERDFLWWQKREAVSVLEKGGKPDPALLTVSARVAFEIDKAAKNLPSQFSPNFTQTPVEITPEARAQIEAAVAAPHFAPARKTVNEMLSSPLLKWMKEHWGEAQSYLLRYGMDKIVVDKNAAPGTPFAPRFHSDKEGYYKTLEDFGMTSGLDAIIARAEQGKADSMTLLALKAGADSAVHDMLWWQKREAVSMILGGRPVVASDLTIPKRMEYYLEQAKEAFAFLEKDEFGDVTLDILPGALSQAAAAVFSDERHAGSLRSVVDNNIKNPVLEWLQENKQDVVSFISRYGSAKLLVDNITQEGQSWQPRLSSPLYEREQAVNRTREFLQKTGFRTIQDIAAPEKATFRQRAKVLAN